MKTALRDYINLLGREDLTPSDLNDEVLDEEGRRVVVDLMLSRVVEQQRNKREHIVIEIKRPNVHIGPEQLMQIQNYATAVSGDRRFATVDTQWEFWIVGDELQDSVKMMANQNNREPGIVVASGGLTVRAVTWAKIIQDARHRLSFVREALDYASSEDAGREYLRQTHGRYLPPLLLASDAGQSVPSQGGSVADEITDQLAS